MKTFYHDELINEIFLLPDYFFIRRIAPFENELHSDVYDIQFKLNNIDRIYIYDHNHEVFDPNEDGYILACIVEIYDRIKVGNKYLFMCILFRKRAKHELDKVTRAVTSRRVLHRNGTLFFSVSVDYFLNSLLKYTADFKDIYKSLQKDSYKIFGDYQYNLYFNSCLKSVAVNIHIPSLKLSCMRSIYKNLPHIFTENGHVNLCDGEIPQELQKDLAWFYKFCFTKEYFYLGVDEYYISYSEIN